MLVFFTLQHKNLNFVERRYESQKILLKERNISGNESNGKARIYKSSKEPIFGRQSKEKDNILSELCANTGYQHKHAIRVLKESKIKEIKRIVSYKYSHTLKVTIFNILF